MLDCVHWDHSSWAGPGKKVSQLRILTSSSCHQKIQSPCLIPSFSAESIWYPSLNPVSCGLQRSSPSNLPPKAPRADTPRDASVQSISRLIADPNLFLLSQIQPSNLISSYVVENFLVSLSSDPIPKMSRRSSPTFLPITHPSIPASNNSRH